MHTDSGRDDLVVGMVLDLIPASRPDTYMCWVDAVGDNWLVVSAPSDESLHLVPLAIGEQVDLVWRGSAELRSLLARLAAVESGEQPRWRLHHAGVVRRGQRRDAVRAPINVPVRLGPDPGIPGTTLDLSEGGLRCLLPKQRRRARPGEEPESSPDFLPPEAGQVIRISTDLAAVTITCMAEVTRRHPRDDEQAELSVRFIGLSEREQDAIRRRVFARLRDLRKRGLL